MANSLLIVSTDILLLTFTADIINYFIHRFLITQSFQLRNYDIQQQMINLENLQTLVNPLFKIRMTNNKQTNPPVLCDLRGTHKSRELSLMHLTYIILLSHLQLMSPLYELFLEIIKAHVSL